MSSCALGRLLYSFARVPHSNGETGQEDVCKLRKADSKTAYHSRCLYLRYLQEVCVNFVFLTEEMCCVLSFSAAMFAPGAVWKKFGGNLADNTQEAHHTSNMSLFPCVYRRRESLLYSQWSCKMRRQHHASWNAARCLSRGLHLDHSWLDTMHFLRGRLNFDV